MINKAIDSYKSLLTCRKIYYKLLLLISIYFFLLPVSYSQSDSLKQYLNIAAKNNPAILLKFNEYQAALQKVPQVGSLPDPELSAGVFLTPMELVNGNQIADIRLMQMFPWFGVLKYSKDEMSLMANAKYEQFRDEKLQVLYDVQRTWYELYKVRKEISISEKNIDILKLIERLALGKFKSAPLGNTVTSSQSIQVPNTENKESNTASPAMQTMGSGQGTNSFSASARGSSSMQTGTMGSSSSTVGLADIYRIQIETGDLEYNIELLQSRQSSIAAQFNAYLNRSVTTAVYTDENIASDSLEYSLNIISDSMLANNPMLGMLAYEKQAVEAREKMVRRMGYPMIGIGLNYSLIGKTQFPMGEPSMNGKDMVMPMVVFTLPVYRKKYNALQKEAEFLKTASVENYKTTSNTLQSDYYQALLLYRDARRRVRLYEDQAQLASKTFDLVLKSFSTSTAGLSEVLRVRQQTLDYELRKVEAVADFNTAVALLKRLGGIKM